MVVVQGLGGEPTETLLEAELLCAGLVQSPLPFGQHALFVDLQGAFVHFCSLDRSDSIYYVEFIVVR